MVKTEFCDISRWERQLIFALNEPSNKQVQVRPTTLLPVAAPVSCTHSSSSWVAVLLKVFKQEWQTPNEVSLNQSYRLCSLDDLDLLMLVLPFAVGPCNVLSLNINGAHAFQPVFVAQETKALSNKSQVTVHGFHSGAPLVEQVVLHWVPWTSCPGIINRGTYCRKFLQAIRSARAEPWKQANSICCLLPVIETFLAESF